MTSAAVNDPVAVAARPLNDARTPRVRLKDKVLLVIPFPVGCYLLVKALLVASGSISDPIDSMMIGTIRGLEAMEGFFCLWLSSQAYFKIRQARKNRLGVSQILIAGRG